MAIVRNTPKLDSYFIKTALIHYWRFENQMISVDEYHDRDVIAFNKKKFIECEVKVAKADLLKDKLKDKHFKYATQTYKFRINGVDKIMPITNVGMFPTHFYFCVPDYLEKVALEEAKSINEKYGVIVVSANTLALSYESYDFSVNIVKKAEPLHKEKLDVENLLWQIGKRASAKLRILYGIG
jgi:hypothetical protein